MSTDESRLSRRGFLRAATGAAAAGAVAGQAAAQEGETRPDWGGWLDGVDGGYTDARGQSEVTVQVGAEGNQGDFAFAPAGLWVDPGTTVKWEWTGKGGGHNVVAEEGPASLDSGDAVDTTGVEYEFTFESGGITTYLCEPHESLGMKGAVAVGDDVATRQTTPTPSPTATPESTPTSSGDGGDGGGGGTREVVVGPGGDLVFDPETVTVTPGTTVLWTWDSDNHNIVVGEQPEGANWEGTEGPPSKTYNTGHSYEFTFETLGTYEYWCEPHKTAGMVGTVEVVESIDTPAAGGGPPPVPDAAKTLGIATVFGMLSTLGLAYFFLRYGGDYGTSDE